MHLIFVMRSLTLKCQYTRFVFVVLLLGSFLLRGGTVG